MPVSKDQSTAEEFESIKEKVQQEIRDIDKEIKKLTRRKEDLSALLQEKAEENK